MASSEQMISQLNLFQRRPLMLSVVNSFIEEYQTKTTLDASTNVVQFTIPPSPTNYTNLNETMLYVRVKITLADGTNIPQNANVGPVNNVLGSLFVNLEHYINDVRVSTSYNNYALVNFLENFMTSENTKVMLQAAGYLEDNLTNPGSMNSTVATLPGPNGGLVGRASWFAQSREVELVGFISTPAHTSTKFFIPNLTFDYKFQLASPNFALMFSAAAGDPSYKLVLTKASLLVKRVACSPSVVMAHSQILASQPALYQVRRYGFSSFTVPAASLNFSKVNLFLGETMPSQVFVLMSNSRNWLGASTRNPWFFQNMSLQSINLRVGEQNIPNTQITLDMAAQIFKRMYMQTLAGMGSLNGGICPDGLSPEAFLESMFILAYDLTRDGKVNSSYLNNLFEKHAIQLDGTFANALAENITINVLGVFPGTIEINSQFVASTDY